MLRYAECHQYYWVKTLWVKSWPAKLQQIKSWLAKFPLICSLLNLISFPIWTSSNSVELVLLVHTAQMTNNYNHMPFLPLVLRATLYNVLLRLARKLLETRENVNISTHPVYHINLEWFSWEWSKRIFFFFFLKEKKIKMADFSKWPFFKIANSRNFFAKISQIGPWVSRIDWWEGHQCDSTYMAVRLSNVSSKKG